MDGPLALLGMTGSELRAAATDRLPAGAGAAGEVFRHALCSGVFAPETLDLAPTTVSGWRRHFDLALPRLVRSQSEPGPRGPTIKRVYARPNGQEFESVHIPMGDARASLCISSQIGCGMACRFCETGRMGFLDHLSAAEIVAQVVSGQQAARAAGHVVPSSIVFMGMGEPLDNVEAVIQAMRVLADRGGLGIAQERFTVCTVGHVDGIHALRDLGWKRLNLSLSLNAADDGLRRTLMPITRTWPLAEIQAALVAFRPRRNFQLGINYCLLPGINDAREQADAVARFCAPLGRVMVYLIPYNPGSHPMTRAPEQAEIERFVGWLREAGLPVRRRVTKGRDVMAACGQLGNLGLRRQQRSSTPESMEG